MNEQILFVQFLHPGGERIPKPKRGNHIPWSTEAPRRKFLKHPGQYIENNSIKDSDLLFWGEWEAQSDIIQHFNPTDSSYPKYLCQPYYSIPQNPNNLQNTDPFVFGDRFHYVCCQQGKISLRTLNRGSVILFGSCLKRQFVLDTVFVVDSYHDIKSFAEAKKLVSTTYQDVTLSRIFNTSCNTSCNQKSENNCNQAISNRLYFGATYNKPVDGMFSFFPCKPYKQDKDIINGFARPIVKIEDVITDNHTQGIKYEHPNYPKNIQTNQKLWQEVRKQVEDANLNLGIYTDLPPRKRE